MVHRALALHEGQHYHRMRLLTNVVRLLSSLLARLNVQRIPGKDHAAVSSLAWTFDNVSLTWRLFSGGLDGLLTEWDLVALRPSSVSDSFGGAVWSLTAEPQQGSPGLHHNNNQVSRFLTQ